MAGVNPSNWQYANWQESTDPAERMAKLALHITEARQAAVATVHSEGRSQSLNTSYITGLERELKDMRAALNLGASIARSSSVPVVVMPQF
jgi:hypothetical protein